MSIIELVFARGWRDRLDGRIGCRDRHGLFAMGAFERFPGEPVVDLIVAMTSWAGNRNLHRATALLRSCH